MPPTILKLIQNLESLAIEFFNSTTLQSKREKEQSTGKTTGMWLRGKDKGIEPGKSTPWYFKARLIRLSFLWQTPGQSWSFKHLGEFPHEKNFALANAWSRLITSWWSQSWPHLSPLPFSVFGADPHPTPPPNAEQDKGTMLLLLKRSPCSAFLNQKP